MFLYYLAFLVLSTFFASKFALLFPYLLTCNTRALIYASYIYFHTNELLKVKAFENEK